MSTTTNHKRTRLLALVTVLLVVAGILGLAPRMGLAKADTVGDFVVTKTFAGDELAGTEEASFTVEIPAGSNAAFPESYTISSSQTPVTIPPGSTSVTFTLKNGETATFVDVVPGTMMVSETAIDGFTTTASATKGGQSLSEVTNLPATVEIAADQQTIVNVTNTKGTPAEVGSLTISKTIAGTIDDALRATAFTFKVDLTKDGNVDNGIYNYKGSKEGTVKSGELFTLKGGESVTIEGIPADTDYMVTEIEAANWISTKTGDTGKIAKDAISTAAFINTYAQAASGALRIAKNVSTDAIDRSIAYEEETGNVGRLQSLQNTKAEIESAEFAFTVNLSDADGKELEAEFGYDGTVGGVEASGTIKSGGTVLLKHKDAITITGLPTGATYKVTENVGEGWKVDEVSKEGTIVDNGLSDASFTNTAVGNLKISKAIKSMSGNELSNSLKDTDFIFTVSFDVADKDVEGEFAYAGDKSGKIKSGGTIILKGGESVTFPDIEAGVIARVEEAPVDKWQASARTLSGDIRLAKARTAAFTNTYQDSGQTGGGLLKISKTVSLPKTDEAIKKAGSSALETLQDRVKQARGEKFTFVVHLTNTEGMSIEDEYDYAGTEAGEEVSGKIKDGGTVTLAHNDTITIAGLPEGTEYTVTENKADNWEVDEQSKNGTISLENASEASFTNTALGSLTISKTIRSASGAELSDSLKATEFTFTVTFTKDNEEVKGEFTYAGDKSGKIKSGDTITLKGGESVTITDLTAGIDVRVAETEVANWAALTDSLSVEIIEYIPRTTNFINIYNDLATIATTPSDNPTQRASSGTTTSRTTTPATADGTNVAVPVVLGVLAAGMVVAGRMTRSKE